MKKNKLYEIRFRDHAKYTRETLICRVVGWLVGETKKDIAIAWWLTEDDEDKDNQETVSILKSAIIKKRLIK